jgi:hypothetical protein
MKDYRDHTYTPTPNPLLDGPTKRATDPLTLKDEVCYMQR